MLYKDVQGEYQDR